MSLVVMIQLLAIYSTQSFVLGKGERFVSIFSHPSHAQLFPVADDLIVVQVGDDGDVKYQYYRGTDMSIVAISQDAVDEPCSPSTSLKADTVSCRVTMKIKLNFSFSPQDGNLFLLPCKLIL